MTSIDCLFDDNIIVLFNSDSDGVAFSSSSRRFSGSRRNMLLNPILIMLRASFSTCTSFCIPLGSIMMSWRRGFVLRGFPHMGQYPP